MKPYDIFMAYISWGDGGKSRPVLVYALDNALVRIYPITTQYGNKSEAIKAKYFEIKNWSQSGLDKQSYIDTGTRLTQNLSAFYNFNPIGALTEVDKKRLIEFLSK
ncbi:MAG: hypothetical protein FWF92_11640 [Oscillospiraceae bacterium]|nr:hypothetical protein [Oscillospiraceae bacterium]